MTTATLRRQKDKKEFSQQTFETPKIPRLYLILPPCLYH